jgi:class 3 adenylate cyclase/tetratricopeptide (TPR) repeat protein
MNPILRRENWTHSQVDRCMDSLVCGPEQGCLMTETKQVTVVFTDLVGSTELSSRLEPAVADRLRETHFSLLRTAIEANGGTEVKNLGDGLMVVFSITSAALNGAEAMQQAIAHHNKRAPEPLTIRVGLSHGEVTEDEEDYFGDAVVEAARLCAKANGGQILATQLVQLNAGRRAKQEFVSLGDLELKGLPEPVPTVEVRWAPAEAIESDGQIPLPRRCLPATTAGFVGRSTERTLLDDALKRVSSEGSHQLVLIGGEPGMGKTTLATECARAAHEDGATVLFGGANEDLGVPYGPWSEALTHLVTHAPAALLESLAPLAGSLAHLAPAVAAALGVTEPTTTSDPEAARYMLFGAVANALRAAGELVPVVLVLDDLQWADSPSLQLLRYVAASEPMRLLVIGTFRESDVAAGHPLADLLGALHREQGTQRISLRGLDDLELLSMMEGVGGQTLDEDGLALRDALVAETDGNPFFVGELLRHLVESGALYQEDGRWVGTADLRDKGLPISVREVIGRRVGRMGDTGTRVLSVASIIGRDFDLSLLAAASELDEDTLLDVLDQATEATLINNVEGNRYSFVHALIEHTLYDSLSPSRRSRLHRKVAEAIETQARSRTEGRAPELAYHWAQASVPEDLDKAVDYAIMAGDQALAGLAPAEALRWFEQALALLEHGSGLPGTGATRCGLMVRLGEAQRQSGEPAYRETLLNAAHLAQELGTVEMLVAAALANNRGFFSAVGIVDVERVAVLEAACEALDDNESAEKAQLLALLAAELTFGGDFPRRKKLADQALAIARSLNDPRILAGVINSFIYSIFVPETRSECLSLSVEGIEAALTTGDLALEFFSSAWRMYPLYQFADAASADEAFVTARDIAERLGQPTVRWMTLIIQATRATLAGDSEEAERLAFAALELGTATGQPDSASLFGAQLANIRSMQGRGNELVDLLRQLLDDNPGMPGFATFLAMLYCDLDRPDDARALLEPFVANRFTSLPMDPAWPVFMASAAYSVAELGWVEAAGGLFEQLRPYADQIPFVGAACYFQMSYSLGRLASTLGLEDEAEAYFSQSVDTHERIGAKHALASTQLAWGRFLLARGEPEDLERASSFLEAALNSAQQLGYGLVERRASQALETLRND